MNLKTIITLLLATLYITNIAKAINTTAYFDTTRNRVDSIKNYDTIAIKYYAKNIKYIESYILYDSMINVPSAIATLERITQIHSSSSGDYFGKNNPSTEDLTKWKTWFEINKDKLCWDNKKDELTICN
jgi:hypothetical protein